MIEKNGAGTIKTPYRIAIIGNSGAGKTTLIGSIFHAVNSQEDYVLRYDLNDKKGIQYLNSIWQNSLTQGEFPPEEIQLDNVEINVSVQSVPQKVKYEFTFSEVQNKIFSTLSQKDETEETFNRFLEFLNNTDMIILVIASDTAHGKDLSTSILFQTLQDHKINIPILFVVSKWDKSETEEDVDPFVRSSMPATYKWLKNGYFKKTEILKFSVGTVRERQEHPSFDEFYIYDFIDSLNTNDSGRIFNWIFEYFNKPSELRDKLNLKLSLLSADPENIDLLKEIKDIYHELGEKNEESGVELKIKSLFEKQKFVLNIGKRIILQQVELNNLDFFGNFKWTLQPGVNVLLGKNGFGKSHLLRLLAALLQKNDNIASEYFKFSKTAPSTRIVVNREDKQETISRNSLVFEEGIGRVPLIAIPDMRWVDKSKTTVSVPEYAKESDLSQYWSDHFLNQKPIDGLIQNFLYQLCITYLDKGKTFDLPIFQLIHKVIEQLSGNPFIFKTIEPAAGQAWFKIEVETEGNPNPMPIQKASQGTLSILAIFGLIYSYLKSVFPEAKEEELTDKPAIIFIDEIDAHLHPSWQQKIIGLLREHFPNAQFIFTAHSPLVVAGCRDGEVSVLRKTDDGFVVKLFEQDFIGYEAGELYEKVFEIEEKDDSYLYYNAVYPFRGEIEEEIKALEKEKEEKGKSFSKENEKKLNRLYDDLRYSKIAYGRFEKRQEYSQVFMENKKLKTKIKKLENLNHTIK